MIPLLKSQQMVFLPPSADYLLLRRLYFLFPTSWTNILRFIEYECSGSIVIPKNHVDCHKARSAFELELVNIFIHVLFDKTFPGEIQRTNLPTPDRKPMTDQSMDTTKVQLGKPLTLIGVTYGYGWEVTRAEMPWRRLHHKVHPSMGDSLQKLGTWSTLHSLQAAQQVGKCPFQVTLV